eukprot:6491866-Amphidinium_carterae.2
MDELNTTNGLLKLYAKGCAATVSILTLPYYDFHQDCSYLQHMDDASMEGRNAESLLLSSVVTQYS